MPTARENRRRWNEYDWPDDGAEWLAGFGGLEACWQRVILPRIEPFLPVEHVLEIGPGHGIWTERLLGRCERMTLVDVADSCVEHCRARFDPARVRCVRNNGRSLPGAVPGSVGFAFSFNSLVHADRRAMAGYASALARALAPGASAFLHHSNLGDLLVHGPGLPEPQRHWRAPDVSAAWFAETCRRAGLSVGLQELVPWGSESLLDCFSLLTRPAPGSPALKATRTVETRDFWSAIQADPLDPGPADRARDLYRSARA